jgi:hypothetical protein
MVRVLLLSSLFLFGCSSTPTKTQIFGNTSLGDPQNSVLTSECDSACNKLLKSKFTFATPLLNPGVGGAILNEIDGKVGGTTTRCLDCRSTARSIYNESGNYGFEIQLASGSHTLKVTKDDYRSTFAENIPITIITKAAHRYFIGNISKSIEGSEWSPVVIDITEMTVLYPNSSPW